MGEQHYKRYFSARFKKVPGRERVWKAVTEHLQQYIPRNATVLDCGAGYGSFINNIKAKKKLAIDIVPESAKHMQKNVRFLRTPITKMPQIKSNSVDVVFASNLMEHLTYDEVSLACKEVKRVLKKGGKFICLQPNYYYAYREYFDDYTHLSVFSHVSLPDRLASEGFKVVKVQKKFTPFSMKTILPKSYWLTKLYLALPISPGAGQMLVIVKK